MPMKRSDTVAGAIGQTKPFRSPQHEGVIALALASAAVNRRFAELFARLGDVTPQQYNVLRILRGAGEAGLPTLDIPERMIEDTPGITRLIDRLEAKGLVERERDGEDRRKVLCRITKAGLALLAKYDDPVESLDIDVFSGLSRREVAALTDLLNKVRATQP